MNAPLVVVSVGTDHHPFDRLIRWVEDWTASLGQDVRLVVQHGASQPSSTGENHTIIPREELLSLFREATVLVTQVGPGTILDANAVGRRPIVMPRDPRRGEHVDGHQIPFGRFMSAQGTAFIAETEDTLHELMTLALHQPERTRVVERTSPAPRTARALEEVVEGVMAAKPGFLSLRRLLQAVRRP